MSNQKLLISFEYVANIVAKDEVKIWNLCVQDSSPFKLLSSKLILYINSIEFWDKYKI